jgi:hypothetical protein
MVVCGLDVGLWSFNSEQIIMFLFLFLFLTARFAMGKMIAPTGLRDFAMGKMIAPTGLRDIAMRKMIAPTGL